MKGTLFSADFIKDNSGNLRLLELNTDTSVIQKEIPNVNWSVLLDLLDANSISTLEVVYKPAFHQGIIDALADAVSGSSVTNFVTHDEDIVTIYPTSVTDSSDKFILRLAYDESAVFDSMYCKNRLNCLKLFTDSDESNSVPLFYYSSSTELVNTLDFSLNESNLPDLVTKDAEEYHNPLSFYKIGSEVEGETSQERWEKFIELTEEDGRLIEQYMFNPDEVVNGKVTSIRSLNIVYGNDLDVINLHSYKVAALFPLPNDISSEINSGTYLNKLKTHHYYEYTTNFVKGDSTGILSTHKLLMSDDTYKEISEIEVGDNLKSYFISGSPQLETDYDIINWSSEGETLPSESFLTSSAVVFKNVESLKYGATIEYVVDGDSLFSGINKRYLVYDSSSNSTSFKYALTVDPTTDYFYDLEANLIDIDEVNFYVTSDETLSMITLDVEETDTYIISGSTAFNGLITHNAPCFVGGTLISMYGGGYKNVEHVQINDTVLSYNFLNGKVEPQKVKGIGSKEVKQTVIYTFKNNTTLRCTLDHPLFSKENGWVSKSPDYTFSKYGLTTKEPEVGFKIQKQDGTEVEITAIEIINTPITVYNVNVVEQNHNFFANEFLVHNRSCFTGDTAITMAGGYVKNIQDIKIGEKVLSLNEVTLEVEEKVVSNVNTPIHSKLVKYVFEDGTKLTCTVDHPIYTYNLKLVSFEPSLTNELYNLDGVVGKIEIGDLFRQGSNSLRLVDIVPYEEETQTFIINVEDNHNFFANGILVHNK